VLTSPILSKISHGISVYDKPCSQFINYNLWHYNQNECTRVLCRSTEDNFFQILGIPCAHNLVFSVHVFGYLCHLQRHWLEWRIFSKDIGLWYYLQSRAATLNFLLYKPRHLPYAKTLFVFSRYFKFFFMSLVTLFLSS
jgi:hypothetical protein